MKEIIILLTFIFLFFLNTFSVFAQICDLTASALPSFGSLDEGQISGNGIFTTLTNVGDESISSLTITGADWLKTSNGLTMGVGQTKWTLDDGKDYETEMTALSIDLTPLGITPFGSTATQNVFLKVKIPSNQAAGSYTQTITFDFTCGE